MRKLIQKIVNWAYGFDVNAEIKKNKEDHYWFDKRIQEFYVKFCNYLAHDCHR